MLDQSAFKKQGEESYISNPQLENDEDIEVGFSLTLSERVYLACFCQIQRFKMLATRSCCLGSTFADQIIAVYQIDGNFNVIVTSLE